MKFHMSTHQIGAAPAEHLRVAAEFLERIVNMSIKASMGIKAIMILQNLEYFEHYHYQAYRSQQ